MLESLVEFLKKKFGRRRRRLRRPNVLFLIDWSNLKINGELPRFGATAQFSIIVALEKAMIKISQEIGPIRNAIAFVPEDEPGLVGPPSADTISKKLQRLNITCRVCARITDKAGKPLDTTDAQIIQHGLKELEREPDPENFCLVLGSGDKDFSPLLTEAKIKYGVRKIAVVAGNLESLAQTILNSAWRNPATGKKAVYLLPNLV